MPEVSRQVTADLCDESRVRGLFEGADAVIHLAARPKPWEKWSAIYENNLKLDGNVFDEVVRLHSKGQTAR